ncbi:hypothetical protein HME9302_01919 [Alteripontixanthobacter maritimus]|uniref:Uncharacterized protein n=1 Tax=Alteripontixanthobacter maritimus TaxID=2161824 RepID=A0A369Q7L6_9SPHN|nr:hypothetical protein [Alteripontixanthobacter maritimus]RDC60704.1 hypothetical protein HME9302_01919 [Alteripontixanthobacter maritimus]
MRITLAIVLATSLVAVPVLAQKGDTPPSNEPSDPSEEIVVAGPGDADDRQNEREAAKTVFAGSRIARQPLIVDTPIATNTSLGGLTPGSGMDPAGGYTRTRRTKTCISSDPAMSKRAACLMGEAQAAYAAGDMAEADHLYAAIADMPELGIDERRAAMEWRYRLARQSGAKETAEAVLEGLIDSGSMDWADEVSARRSLVASALRSGDKGLALERLVSLRQAGMADAQNLANLAILGREQGLPDTAETMRAAIAKLEADGRDIPAGWREFAAETNPN